MRVCSEPSTALIIIITIIIIRARRWRITDKRKVKEVIKKEIDTKRMTMEMDEQGK